MHRDWGVGEHWHEALIRLHHRVVIRFLAVDGRRDGRGLEVCLRGNVMTKHETRKCCVILDNFKRYADRTLFPVIVLI